MIFCSVTGFVTLRHDVSRGFLLYSVTAGLEVDLVLQPVRVLVAGDALGVTVVVTLVVAAVWKRDVNFWLAVLLKSRLTYDRL